MPSRRALGLPLHDVCGHMVDYGKTWLVSESRAALNMHWPVL